jgi:hypothetical protein
MTTIQMHVASAFLHGLIGRIVHVELITVIYDEAKRQPHVAQLLKAIYGFC